MYIVTQYIILHKTKSIRRYFLFWLSLRLGLHLLPLMPAIRCFENVSEEIFNRLLDLLYLVEYIYP